MNKPKYSVGDITDYPGDTELRDQFAMAALTGMLLTGAMSDDKMAKQAYIYADAMLKARIERKL